MNTLSDLQKQIHETAVEKGWWEDDRNFGMVLALIHSEISEALEAWRESPVHFYLGAPSGPLVEGPRKPEGWGIELADAVIRILDVCEVHGLNLQDLIEMKMEYNKTRSYRHGGKRA
jgi:hypothetical protein